MKISLIGMSGSGKSYWSKKLHNRGFSWFCIDDLLEEKLGDEFRKHGYSGIQHVAKWMGQPFDPQYKRSSSLYLESEKESLEEVFEYTKKANKYENIVIDTTGSIIYLGENILETLKQLTKIIYFDTPASVKEKMYQLYLKDSKPVIWGNAFKKVAKEDNFTALARCYPQLLSYRTKKYQKLADITLDYKTLHDPKFSVEIFLDMIG